MRHDSWVLRLEHGYTIEINQVMDWEFLSQFKVTWFFESVCVSSWTTFNQFLNSSVYQSRGL